MPHVPLTFEYPDDADPIELLEREERDGLIAVRWPALALALVHAPPADEWSSVDLEDVARQTPTFRRYGQYGFGLGQYAEVLALQDVQDPEHAVVQLGPIELTVGEPTPLFRYLFAREHDSDVHGEWEFLSSLRLWMCPPDLAEVSILEGLAALRRQPRVGLQELRLYPLFEFEYPDDESRDDQNVTHIALPSPVTDVEPLRLYHDGSGQRDATTAILQYYRVLEYYSVVSRHGELDVLRRRADLTSRQFTLEVAKVIGDDERSSICRLVAALADGQMLTDAAKAGLVERPEPHLLGNRLYDFRNSIVHAKHDHRTQMFVPSVFEDPPELTAWRTIVGRLARVAIDTLGARRI